MSSNQHTTNKDIFEPENQQTISEANISTLKFPAKCFSADVVP